MRAFVGILTLSLLLTSCVSNQPSSTQLASNFINQQQVVMTTQQKYPAKNPKNIALYQAGKSPHRAYRVIGVATISKYNLLGLERKNTTLNQMMKNLAASIGGDALIDVSHQGDDMKANVIAFQRILI
jgi:hypothetical protein